MKAVAKAKAASIKKTAPPKDSDDDDDSSDDSGASLVVLKFVFSRTTEKMCKSVFNNEIIMCNCSVIIMLLMCGMFSGQCHGW